LHFLLCVFASWNLIFIRQKEEYDMKFLFLHLCVQFDRQFE